MVYRETPVYILEGGDFRELTGAFNSNSSTKECNHEDVVAGSIVPCVSLSTVGLSDAAPSSIMPP